MTILITGATGTVGRALVAELGAQGVAFTAMTRGNVASLPPGTARVHGDFDDASSLARALEGVERAFLLTPSTSAAEDQQLRFVEAARIAGVRHVVKLSQWAADARSPVRFLRYHAAVEEALRASGMAFTFLRPNLFMQALLGFAASVQRDGKLFAPGADARISLIDVRDIAAVAAAALTSAGHEGRTYDLTGPEALTHDELAAALARVRGKDTAFVHVDDAAMRGALLGMGMPSWQLEGLLEDYAHYRRGEAETVTTTVREVTGTPARSFEAFAQEHAGAFA
ncbi:MAG: hypothetical protein JWP97_4152 [Labilithrix sp.]|nr:hypothetical protein [Labilithrix sp.]